MKLFIGRSVLEQVSYWFKREDFKRTSTHGVSNDSEFWQSSIYALRTTITLGSLTMFLYYRIQWVYDWTREALEAIFQC